jgi:circadian clock protein KaiC
MAIDKLLTGVPGLDTITHGGIPRGRTTLVTGKSGSSKTILSLQIACNLAARGVKAHFIAVEEATEDLLTTGEGLGLPVKELVASGALRITDLTRPLEGPTVISGTYDVAGLIHRVEGAAKEAGAEVVVLDSATALFSPRPPASLLRSHFFALVSAFRRLGLTAVITAEAPADYGQLTTLGVEDYVCDLVIILRNLIDGERRRRSIEVHKYRRSPHYKGEFPCTITSRGVVTFPLGNAEAPVALQSERFSSGLQGLDEMNAGGWLRDSIILVRGPSGSGKTTLAGMYARAGAARGEQVIYYGFEETKPILLRNFASVGLSMADLEAKGTLRVQCRYPEATSPEDLLIDLRTSLDEFKPSLIVLDSVSSIEHSTSPRGFRQFMIGVGAQGREHSRSALLTQTTDATRADTFSPFLSTLPDAILMLDYSLDTHEMERSIRVLKMRGSAHAQSPHRLQIGPGGLKVEPMAPRAAGTLSRKS